MRQDGGRPGAIRAVLALLLERLTLAALTALAALVLFVVVAYAVNAGDTRRLDIAVFHFFQDHQTPFLHGFMTGVSLLASGGALIVVALACILLAWFRPAFRPNALSMLVALGGGEGVIEGLKALFHRARPEPLFASLGYSFPSGHAFFAVILYGMLAYWLTRDKPERRRLWGVGTVLILLIAFSRVFLGVHYASDVVGGLLAALPWLWGCLALPPAFGFIRRAEKKEA